MPPGLRLLSEGSFCFPLAKLWSLRIEPRAKSKPTLSPHLGSWALQRYREASERGEAWARLSPTPRQLGSAIKNRETLYTHIRPLEGDEQRHGETGGDDCLGAGPTLARRSRAEAEAQDPGIQQLICEKVCCALPTANANTAAPPATTRTPAPAPTTSASE